jgi:hypothetical protein
MDEDTKLVLGAWRGVLVENYRLQRRVADLENILEKEYGYVGKRINYDEFVGSRRRIGIGHGGDVDGCD